VEFHRGRPILHSLGNFAIEQPSAFMERLTEDRGFREISRLNKGWQPGRKYMNPEETRHSVIARLTLGEGDGGEVGLTLVPCRIDDESVPHALGPGAPAVRDLLDYLVQITGEAGLTTGYALEADGMIRAFPSE